MTTETNNEQDLYEVQDIVETVNEEGKKVIAVTFKNLIITETTESE